MGNQKSSTKSRNKNLKSLVVKTLDSSMLNKSWDPNDLYNNFLEKVLENKENIQRSLTKKEYFNDTLQLKRRKPLNKIFDFRSNLKSFEIPINLISSVITSYINNNLNESDYKSILDLTVFNILPVDLKDMYFNHTNLKDKQKLMKQILKSLETKTDLLNKLENSEIINFLNKSDQNDISVTKITKSRNENVNTKDEIQTKTVIEEVKNNTTNLDKRDALSSDKEKQNKILSKTPTRSISKSRNFVESRMLNMINKTYNKSINNTTINQDILPSHNKEIQKSTNYNELSQRTVNNPYIKGKLSLNKNDDRSRIERNRINNLRSRYDKHESELKHSKFTYDSKSVGKLKESLKSSNTNFLNTSGISQIKIRKDYSPVNSRNEGSFIKALEYGYNLFKTSKSPLNYRNHYSESNKNNLIPSYKESNNYHSNTIIYETKIPDFSKIETYNKELSTDKDSKSKLIKVKKVDIDNQNIYTNNLLHSHNYEQIGYVDILKNKINLLKSKLIEKKDQKNQRKLSSNHSSSRKDLKTINTMLENDKKNPIKNSFHLNTSNLQNSNNIYSEKSNKEKVVRNKPHIININSHVTNINPIMYHSGDQNKHSYIKENTPYEKSEKLVPYMNSNKSTNKSKDVDIRMTANFKNENESNNHKHTKTNSFGINNKNTKQTNENFDDNKETIYSNEIPNQDRFSFNRITFKETRNSENNLTENSNTSKYVKKKIPFANNMNSSIRSEESKQDNESLNDVNIYSTLKTTPTNDQIKPFNKKLDLSNLINKKIVKK